MSFDGSPHRPGTWRGVYGVISFAPKGSGGQGLFKVCSRAVRPRAGFARASLPPCKFGDRRHQKPLRSNRLKLSDPNLLAGKEASNRVLANRKPT
jgi:hypothetical protein